MGRSGRVFPQGRFRGNDLYCAELEWRFSINIIKSKPDLLGGVIFKYLTSASDRSTNVNLFQYIVLAAGVGLRIMNQKESRAKLTIDYGWGPDGAGAFYLNLNEYF